MAGDSHKGSTKGRLSPIQKIVVIVLKGQPRGVKVNSGLAGSTGVVQACTTSCLMSSIKALHQASRLALLPQKIGRGLKTLTDEFANAYCQIDPLHSIRGMIFSNIHHDQIT